MFPRFQPDVFGENLKLVKEVEKVASRKGCSPAQIALGWVLAQSKSNGLPEILPIPGATTTERIEENTKPAKLDDNDLATIDEILKKVPIIGDRYHPALMAFSDV